MTTSTNETTARIYVGTYAKYNAGSIAGAWLSLEDFGDRDAFYKACAKLHADESDPEFMFQDFEGFPRALYSESNVSDDVFAYIELDDDDRELLGLYQDHIESDADIETARDRFIGKANSESDWAAEYLEESGELDRVPESLRHYIDFESYARDAQLGGDVVFVRHGGDVWVFANR